MISALKVGIGLTILLACCNSVKAHRHCFTNFSYVNEEGVCHETPLHECFQCQDHYYNCHLDEDEGHCYKYSQRNCNGYSNSVYSTAATCDSTLPACSLTDERLCEDYQIEVITSDPHIFWLVEYDDDTYLDDYSFVSTNGVYTTVTGFASSYLFESNGVHLRFISVLFGTSEQLITTLGICTLSEWCEYGPFSYRVAPATVAVDARDVYDFELRLGSHVGIGFDLDGINYAHFALQGRTSLFIEVENDDFTGFTFYRKNTPSVVTMSNLEVYRSSTSMRKVEKQDQESPSLLQKITTIVEKRVKWWWWFSWWSDFWYDDWWWWYDDWWWFNSWNSWWWYDDWWTISNSSFEEEEEDLVTIMYQWEYEDGEVHYDAATCVFERNNFVEYYRCYLDEIPGFWYWGFLFSFF